MRYTPATLALALLVAVTSSTGYTAPPLPLDPRAASLVSQGRAALAAGDAEAALDSFETALAIQPGHVSIVLNLGEAARKQGLPGKALHYYRKALIIDPNNQYALAGEGEALVEKGALEKAKASLARIQQLCGNSTCGPARQLSAAIERGPVVQVVSAEAVQAAPVVTEN